MCLYSEKLAKFSLKMSCAVHFFFLESINCPSSSAVTLRKNCRGNAGSLSLENFIMCVYKQ
jgi:hypothetical protein